MGTPSAPALPEPTLGATLRSLVQWAIGGAILIAGTIAILLVSLVRPPYSFHRLMMAFIRPLVWATRADVRVHGLEKLDPKTPYIFMVNHVNMFDHFFFYSVLNRRMTGVEKELHFRWPIYGTLIRAAGLIPIPPRGDTQRALRSLEKLKGVFAQGVCLMLMPEGTRSVTGKLGPFKKGVFYLAVQCQAPIVPLTMTGAYRFNRKGDWRIYPGPIDFHIDDPIPTAGRKETDVTPLRNRVREIIAARLHAAGEE
jgi:1-acyl-sn-glycerol-3-phosphate acyltransferase